MKGKFGVDKNSETGVRDVYDEVLRLKNSFDDQNKNIRIIESQLHGAVDLLPTHDQRLILLEQGKQHHADQLQHLQTTVGIETKEVPAAPALNETEPCIEKRSLKIIRDGPDVTRKKHFIDVVNQVSIKERQKQYKDR